MDMDYDPSPPSSPPLPSPHHSPYHSLPRLTPSNLSPSQRLIHLFLQNDSHRPLQPSKAFQSLKKEYGQSPQSQLDRGRDETWEQFRAKFEAYSDARETQLRRMETENEELKNLVSLQRMHHEVLSPTKASLLSPSASVSSLSMANRSPEQQSFMSTFTGTTFLPQNSLSKSQSTPALGTGMYANDDFSRRPTDIHRTRRPSRKGDAASCLNPVDDGGGLSPARTKQYEKKFLRGREKKRDEDEMLRRQVHEKIAGRMPPPAVSASANTNYYSPIKTLPAPEPYSALPDPVPIKGRSSLNNLGRYQQQPRGRRQLGNDFISANSFISREWGALIG